MDVDKAAGNETENSGAAVAVTKKRFSCWKCLFWTFSVLVAVVAIIAGYVYIHTRQSEIPTEILENIGTEGVQLFMAYDRDGDGYLSIHEFESLYHRFADSGANLSIEADTVYEQPIDENDNFVTVVASFQPLLLETMTREKDNQESWTYSGLDPIKGLKEWKKLNNEWANFAARHFKVFLPPIPALTPMGMVYHVVKDNEGLLSMFQSDLSSNRYFPPFVADEYVTIHRLLSLFHPRPFIFSRFKPRGSVAIIRAINEDYVDIAFRIHAEFQLNEPPYHPFWFTPGQFTGNLIMSKDSEHIVDFNLHVPATNKLNVDMEWLEGAKNMVVDIGFMPEMALRVSSPSVPVNKFNISEKLKDAPASTDSIVWLEEISQEEALRKLEVELYPFKKVNYFNFTESFRVAQKEEKLVHSIILWGALDDQSC